MKHTDEDSSFIHRAVCREGASDWSLGPPLRSLRLGSAIAKALNPAAPATRPSLAADRHACHARPNPQPTSCQSFRTVLASCCFCSTVKALGLVEVGEEERVWSSLLFFVVVCCWKHGGSCCCGGEGRAGEHKRERCTQRCAGSVRQGTFSVSQARSQP